LAASSAAAALTTAALSSPALRLHFLRRAQLPRLCRCRGWLLHHRRLPGQHLRAVQHGRHIRRRLVPASTRLPRVHRLICSQLSLVGKSK
jgi:hypothetical protein